MRLFDPRSPDWWVYTTLSIIIVVVLPFIALLFGSDVRYAQAAHLLSSHLLIFSIVLSATDLGLWAGRERKQEEGKDYRASISRQILIIVISTLMLASLEGVASYNPHPNLVLCFSALMGFGSLWLYNHNPESSDLTDDAISKAKSKGEAEFDERIRTEEPQDIEVKL